MKKHLGHRFKNLHMWLMLSPYLLLLLIFGAIPVVMAILEVPHESRTNPDGGWDAFNIVLHDFRFLPAVGHVLGFMAIFVPLTIVPPITPPDAEVYEITSSPIRKYPALVVPTPTFSKVENALESSTDIDPVESAASSILNLVGLTSDCALEIITKLLLKYIILCHLRLKIIVRK